MNFKDMEIKSGSNMSQDKEAVQERIKETGLPDGLKAMLVDALKETSSSNARFKALELALQLPEVESAEGAVAAAQTLLNYIQGEPK